MEKTHKNQSRELATKADLRAMKTEIIDAVKDTVTGLATQDTVNAVMETEAERGSLTATRSFLKKNAAAPACSDLQHATRSGSISS